MNWNGKYMYYATHRKSYSVFFFKSAVFDKLYNLKENFLYFFNSVWDLIIRFAYYSRNYAAREGNSKLTN